MSDNGLLMLKWDHCIKKFSEALCNVKKTEYYSDVTISCDGKLYKAHRLVLSMCSDYMDKLFQNIEEGNSFNCNLVVVLKDISSKELESLLDFIYAGEVEVQQKDLPQLIKAAEYLGIKGFSNSNERETVKSSDVESLDDLERPSGSKRSIENDTDNDTAKKLRDDSNDNFLSSSSKDAGNVPVNDGSNDHHTQQVNSPPYANSENTKTSLNDSANAEIIESNCDTEPSSHERNTEENNGINVIDHNNDSPSIEKVQSDDSDNSSDIIIEGETIATPAIIPHFIEGETIATPAIIPHFKPMDPQPTPGSIVNLPGTSGIQWMDYHEGHSIQTNISNIPILPSFKPKQRFRRSPAWIGFDDMGPGREHGTRIVKCKLCGIVKVSKGGSTSPMSQHIKMHHKNDGSGLSQKLEELEEKKRRQKRQENHTLINFQ